MVYADHIICNNCCWKGYITLAGDECPNCHCLGTMQFVDDEHPDEEVPEHWIHKSRTEEELYAIYEPKMKRGEVVDFSKE